MPIGRKVARMRSSVGGAGLLAAGVLTLAACGAGERPLPDMGTDTALRELPEPTTGQPGELEAAITDRRSVRSFDDAPVTDAQLGQLAWAAQGRTGADGGRAAPSAGATYPLELLAVTADGVARYHPDDHALSDHLDDDQRSALARAAHGQEWLADAGLVLVVTGVIARTAERYGDRAERYVLLEAGHAAQNVLLQAVALELGATPVGAFDAAEVRAALDLPADEEALYLLAIGVPAD